MRHIGTIRPSRSVDFSPRGQVATRLARISSILLLLLATPGAFAQDGRPASLRGVGFDQNLDGQVPLELTFADETGNPVRIGDCLDGKPTILVLAYFRCPMLCGQVLNGLTRSMLDMSLNVGEDFNVLTVSFDPRETPEMAAASKKVFLQRYGRPGAAHGWHFLTGSQEPIKRLTDAVGFRYRYDAAKDQFAHAAGIVVLTPAGKISRYFYDVHFPPRDLRLGLVEASANQIGSPVDQALLFCFHYDPEQGKYGLVIMNLVRLGGILTLLALAGFMWLLWRRERRSRRAASGGA